MPCYSIGLSQNDKCLAACLSMSSRKATDQACEQFEHHIALFHNKQICTPSSTSAEQPATSHVSYDFTSCFNSTCHSPLQPLLATALLHPAPPLGPSLFSTSLSLTAALLDSFIHLSASACSFNVHGILLNLSCRPNVSSACSLATSLAPTVLLTSPSSPYSSAEVGTMGLLSSSTKAEDVGLASSMVLVGSVEVDDEER